MSYLCPTMTYCECIKALIISVMKFFYHYPFGMQIENQSYTSASSTYRYSFNGKEQENELNGGIYNMRLRFYDSRIAKMFKRDPRTKEYPWQSPYVYHRNNPIAWIDYMGGGDPPASEQISKLLTKSDQEYANAEKKGAQAEAKYREALSLLDKASEALKDNPESAENQLKAIELSEQAMLKIQEGASLDEQAGEHQNNAQKLTSEALALVPKMMEEYYAELDKLKDWKREAKIDAVVDIVAKELGLHGLVGVGTIEIFGPTLDKTPAMGSKPYTSRWSKYVASKWPINAGTRLPGGGASVTRAAGRLAVPLMLAWESARTVRNIHDLYQMYENGPTEAEIQYYLDDFEQWKLDNPE